MSKFAKFTLIKFVLPTDTSSEKFCKAYYFLHGSLQGKFSVVKSCNTILFDVTFTVLQVWRFGYKLMLMKVDINFSGWDCIWKVSSGGGWVGVSRVVLASFVQSLQYMNNVCMLDKDQTLTKSLTIKCFWCFQHSLIVFNILSFLIPHSFIL